MKRKIASILSAVILIVSLTSCTIGGGGKGNGNGKGIPKNTNPSETTLPKLLPGKPSHDLSKVDVFKTFDDYTVADIDKPWGSTHKLKMAKGDVDNFFIYFALDRNNNMLNENMNNMSTVTSPRVKVYACEDKPGYITYEVNYEQIVPIYSRQPISGVSRSLFFYHNVSYVDFYSGSTFPVIDLTPEINSFGITGNVIYKGKKYELGYYEFRSQESADVVAKNEGSSRIIKETIKLKSTAYFIVPEWYDGILMCVYIANDTNRPVAEILADSSTALEQPGPFGDDENIDDYVFFGISGPQ